MIYSRGLSRFLEHRPDALDVLELEPQTLWFADDPIRGPFRPFAPAMAAFAELPQRKLVHSVGMPLGGTRRPNSNQLALVRAAAETLDSPWISEHLSVAGTPHRAAGFLLPPLQTEEGVAAAAANIRTFNDGVGRPVAVETGTAYIRRKPFEMRDGAFLARVVREADCGILLDIHNIFCNERNGRILIDDFIADIPLDRVWEVHLAGGGEMDGFYLDAHSGPMAGDIRARAEEVIRHLPNLGAINFEIYDSFLDGISLEAFDDIIADLRDLWNQAGRDAGRAHETAATTATAGAPAVREPSPRQWEEGLTAAIARPEATPGLFRDDGKALSLYSKLVSSFRGSLLTRSLPRGMRYLILREGDAIDTMLAAFFAAVPAQLYAPLEAHAFARWIRAEPQEDTLLDALIAYDLALVDMARDPAPRVVHFPGDPVPIFEALSEARLPAPPEPPAWELEILPDQAVAERLPGSAGGS